MVRRERQSPTNGLIWLGCVLASRPPFAVGLGPGKVIPTLTKADRWPYTLLGGGFALIGIGLVIYGLARKRAVESGILRGVDARTDQRVVAGLSVAVVFLGVVLLVIITVD